MRRKGTRRRRRRKSALRRLVLLVVPFSAALVFGIAAGAESLGGAAADSPSATGITPTVSSQSGAPLQVAAAGSLRAESGRVGQAVPAPPPVNTSQPPSEPSGHRPAVGTVSLLVKLVSGLTTAQEQALLTAYGGTERTSISALHLYVVDVPAAQATAIGARYLADRRVKSVELDHVRKTAASPSDPLYSSQWNLPQIGWDHVYGSVTPTGTATIAILDTGVDASHPDLAGRVLPGDSAFAGSDPLTDPNGPRTETAGITGAVTDNQTGVAGVAYSGVSIIPVQVLDSAGVGQDSDIVNGVIWAADNRASVILMPFSNSGFSQNLQDAISYAWSKGAVLVAATGNDGSPNATYPAGDADVVGVSATDPTDALWSGSNYGVDTVIAAPGVNIPTTNPGGTYTTISGTSASSAMVAGVAAFERAVDPAASNAVIVGRLAHDADPAGTAGQTGNGRVNMQRVVADTSSISATPAGVPGGGPLLGPYTVAALHDGDGSMTVTPTTAVAGSTGNSFTFTFTAGAGGGNMNGGAVAMTVPIGWTTPQTTNSANPGFISTATGTCDVVSTAITGTGPWTVTFTVGNCSTSKLFTFTYGGGGTKVTAPTTAGAYQFTTQTKVSGGTLTNIQPPQPTITVNPAAASKLVFTTSALSFTATSSPTAGPITVQSQDSFGNPSNPSSTEMVALTSSSPDSPRFSLTSGGSTLTSVSIPSSANSVSFFYGDTKAGTPAITATGSGAFSSTVTQTETVTTGSLDHLSLSPITSSLTFGQSQTYIATGQDQFNNSLGDVTSASTFAITPDGSCVAATCTPSSATSHTVTGTDSGKTGTASLAVNKADTTTVVASSTNPSVSGQSVTFTATVSVNSPGSAAVANPTGTVTFAEGLNTLGTGTLSTDSGGVTKASFSTSTLSTGSHNLTATYGGDTNFTTSIASLTQVVNKADTTTTVVSSVNPSVSGQWVTFTATVSVTSPGSAAAANPTGTVTFKDGSTTLGTGTLSTGGGVTTASFSTSTLTTTSHSLAANYGGDINFNSSSGSLTQTVNPASTTTSLSSSANPSVSGQSVTFTATVSVNSPGSTAVANPTGTLTYAEGLNTLGTGTLSTSGGVTSATFTISSLSTASHNLTATYGGDTNFTTTLPSPTQVGKKTATTTPLVPSANPPASRQSGTFTAPPRGNS